MIPRLRYFFFSVLTILLCSNLPQPRCATEKLIFSTGAPLDALQARLIIPLLKEAFKRNGIEFQAVYYPSPRSLMLSNSGKVDGELHRVYEFHDITQGKYPNLIRIESQLLSIWLSAFATKNLNINTWEDLKGHTVVYYRGRKNVEKYLARTMHPQLLWSVKDDHQAFEMLAGGRVDIAISESRGGHLLIDTHAKFANIKELAQLKETKIYAYINKKHEHLAGPIAKTIEEMKHDGTVSQLLPSATEAVNKKQD